MRNSFLVSLLPLVLLGSGSFLTGSLSAQSNTVPKGFDKKEAGWFHWPSFRYAPARVQYLYNKSVLPWTGSKKITGLKVRPDMSVPKSFTGHSYQIEIMISTKGVRTTPFPNVSSFKANHGSDKKVVLKKTTINFPRFQPSAAKPAPFILDFVFDTPFVAAADGLVVDIKAYASKYQDNLWHTDAELISNVSSPFGSVTSFGTGCPSNFQVFGTKVFPGSGPLEMYGYSRVSGKKAAGIAWFGLSDKLWNGVPLPAKIGTTGCSIYTDLFVVAPRLTDGSPLGRINSVPITLPPDPKLAGLQFFFQFGVIDLAYNSAGMRFSQGGKTVIGKGYNASKVPFLALYDYSNQTVSFDPDSDVPYFIAPYGTIFQVY